MVAARLVPMLLCGLLLGCGERGDAASPQLPAATSFVGPPRGETAPRPSAANRGSSAPQALETRARRLTLAAGGDVNFGRECGQEILKTLEYDPFAGLGAAWKAADARFVNLESQLSDQQGVTQSPGNRLIFSGPPGGADVLMRANISLVSTANNHAWDYGRKALLETIFNLERAGVLFAGTGRDREQAYRPALLRVSGASVALFAVTQIWNQGVFQDHEAQSHVAWADIEQLKAGIQRARLEHDFVLVSYHGGEEYIDAPVDKTRRFVKQVMELGVDAFIGHHPHVPQGIGWVEGRPVIYSLGNLVFAGHDHRPWTKHSFFVRLSLEKGKTPELSACPYAIEGHRPRSLSPEESVMERLRAHLLLASTSVGGSLVDAPDELGCWRVTPKRPRGPLPADPKSPKRESP